MDLRFSLIGLIIGFLIGLTGMGGGSLMTPVMILIMGVKPVIAVGTDLAYGAVTKIVGGGTHLRQRNVNIKTALLLACGSVPATLVGVGLITAIKRQDPTLIDIVLLHAIAWMLIVVAAAMAAKPFLLRLSAQLQHRDDLDWRDRAFAFGDRHVWMLPLVGGIVGFLVGLTSVGSGTLIIVALMFMYPRWQSKDLVGTDVFHAAILVSAASFAQLAAGNVNVPMMLSLLVGSIPGVLLGSRLTLGFPESVLRLSLASVLLVSATQLL
jgi:uncharacterized membrane protein YfcA